MAFQAYRRQEGELTDEEHTENTVVQRHQRSYIHITMKQTIWIDSNLLTNVIIINPLTVIPKRAKAS